MLEQLGWGFTALCVLLASISAARSLVFNTKLQTHLKIHHPNMWKEFLGEGTDLFRNVYLKPMNADRSYFYFTFRSVDDLGDKQVHDYKRHVRAGIFGFLIYAVAAMVGFLMTGLLLSLSRQ